MNSFWFFVIFVLFSLIYSIKRNKKKNHSFWAKFLKVQSFPCGTRLKTSNFWYYLISITLQIIFRFLDCVIFKMVNKCNFCCLITSIERRKKSTKAKITNKYCHSLLYLLLYPRIIQQQIDIYMQIEFRIFRFFFYSSSLFFIYNLHISIFRFLLLSHHQQKRLNNKKRTEKSEI